MSGKIRIQKEKIGRPSRLEIPGSHSIEYPTLEDALFAWRNLSPKDQARTIIKLYIFEDRQEAAAGSRGRRESNPSSYDWGPALKSSYEVSEIV
jgi:hypothetical protein